MPSIDSNLGDLAFNRGGNALGSQILFKRNGCDWIGFPTSFSIRLCHCQNAGIARDVKHITSRTKRFGPPDPLETRWYMIMPIFFGIAFHSLGLCLDTVIRMISTLSGRISLAFYAGMSDCPGYAIYAWHVFGGTAGRVRLFKRVPGSGHAKVLMLLYSSCFITSVPRNAHSRGRPALNCQCVLALNRDRESEVCSLRCTCCAHSTLVAYPAFISPPPPPSARIRCIFYAFSCCCPGGIRIHFGSSSPA